APSPLCCRYSPLRLLRGRSPPESTAHPSGMRGGSPVAPLRGLECARAPPCEWSCDMLEPREQEALMTVQSKSAPATTAALDAGLIYLDGDMVPQEQATISVLTHGLHYGTSVFEGIRAYATDRGAAVFRLTDHSKRLLA